MTIKCVQDEILERILRNRPKSAIWGMDVRTPCMGHSNVHKMMNI